MQFEGFYYRLRNRLVTITKRVLFTRLQDHTENSGSLDCLSDGVIMTDCVSVSGGVNKGVDSTPHWKEASRKGNFVIFFFLMISSGQTRMRPKTRIYILNLISLLAVVYARDYFRPRKTHNTVCHWDPGAVASYCITV